MYDEAIARSLSLVSQSAAAIGWARVGQGKAGLQNNKINKLYFSAFGDGFGD
jgi:hypothetical protein